MLKRKRAFELSKLESSDSVTMAVRKRMRDTCIAHLTSEAAMGAVSLRLPDDITARLQALADRTGRSKTYYMIEAIREHIEDLEDLYVAEQRLLEVRSGRAKSVPLDDLMKQYGLAD